MVAAIGHGYLNTAHHPWPHFCRRCGTLQLMLDLESSMEAGSLRLSNPAWAEEVIQLLDDVPTETIRQLSEGVAGIGKMPTVKALLKN